MNPKRILLSVGLLLFLAGSAMAKPWWMRGIESNQTDFLPPDVAFRTGARVEGGTILVHWVIADGYYLYKQKISVAPESPDLIVSTISLPPGTLKTDPYLGTQEIYTHEVEGSVTYRRFDYGAHPLEIRVSYQGCAEAGLCYPLIAKVLSPAGAPTAAPSSPPSWEWVAIGGGFFAFLLAGLLLRKGRTLPLPAA